MRTRATFRLTGDAGGSARQVTELLGLRPTYAREVGEPHSSRTTSKLVTTSTWQLSSAASPEDGVELAGALNSVLRQLEPVAANTWELVQQGYWANWFCFVGSHATEHAVEIDRSILTRLLSLPGELWLDLYPEDEPDEDGTSGSTLAPRRSSERPAHGVLGRGSDLGHDIADSSA